jgi:hypothetical protein
VQEAKGREDSKETEKAYQCFKHSKTTVAQKEELPVGQAVGFGVTRLALHEVAFGELVCETDGGSKVCAEVDGQNHYDFERERDSAWVSETTRETWRDEGRAD